MKSILKVDQQSIIARLEFLQISMYKAVPKISAPNTINGIKMKIFVFRPILLIECIQIQYLAFYVSKKEVHSIQALTCHINTKSDLN